ncbi:MAG: hypothetical protein KGJ02_06910, partial [Verrucomicrobiota bacterium]|nr:hypothetical protein [Verrucomicrobiota bacterium]
PQDSFPCVKEWLQDPNIIVIRFEDLIGPRGGGSLEAQRRIYLTLATHLGYTLTLEQIDEIAKNSFGGTWTFRNGQIEEWKTAYSESNKALFNQLFGWTLVDFGYANDLNW